MIIFNLDGTLADCEHRQHFVDPSKNVSYSHRCTPRGKENFQELSGWYHIETNSKFKPNWKDFYEACDQDKPIEPVVIIWHFFEVGFHLNPDNYQIWTDRCESVREKTVEWLQNNLCIYNESWLETNLKMRPIVDSTPDDELKERWLDEALAQGKTIDFVFDDRKKVCDMWRRRGIFVFNCCQHDREF